MNRDRIAALVALVAALLAGTGLPSKLGLGSQAVAIIGGLLVGLAATARTLIFNEGRPAPDWRDVAGALLGLAAVGLGIESAAVDQLDPDAFAGLSSLAAALMAWQRGGGSVPTSPATGLVLLVLLGGCGSTVQAIWVGFALYVALAIGVVLTPEQQR